MSSLFAIDNSFTFKSCAAKNEVLFAAYDIFLIFAIFCNIRCLFVRARLVLNKLNTNSQYL